MHYFLEKYVAPFTSYGFKKLFGEEINKDLLLDFLNELLKEDQGLIKDLTYLETEYPDETGTTHKTTFDSCCENARGEKFIVEILSSKHHIYKDSMDYLSSTFPILKKTRRPDWNYELKAVYTIAILDFVFDADKGEPHKLRYDVKLSDIETNKVFYDKLTFIYLEMPKFNKTIDELETRFDKWLYVIKNMNKLDRVPDKLRERIFDKLFETAEIARFTPDQINLYEDSLKYYRDLKNSLDTARDEGKLEGKMEAKLEVARNLLANGAPIDLIIQSTELSKEEIQRLR